MEHTSAAINEKVIGKKHGFTLLELLVVLAIIGILAAIAIPQYAAYRRNAIDTQMQSDVKSASIAMESYFGAKYVYPTTIAEITAFGFQQTQGVTLVINLLTPSTYTIVASKPSGTQPSFIYDSVTGRVY